MLSILGSKKLLTATLLAVLLLVLQVFAAVNAYSESVRSSSVNGLRLWRAPDHTRLVFDLSEAVNHKVISLTGPDRLVINIENTKLNADLGTIISGLDFASSPIKAIRSGVHEKKNLRIVLDLRQAVRPRSFTLPSNEQYGDRLVVDLYDRKAETTKTVEDVTAKNNRRDIIIAIDAGHGGEDPGAIGPKRIQEKKVVLAISRELKKLFDRTSGYKAVLVRSGDYYIPLRKRTSIAHDKRADLFISIHADAFEQASANGVSVFALSRRGATSETARYLAGRENRADLIGGAGSVSLGDKDKMLAGVLLDLSMTATLSSSLEVGAEVLKSMGGVARLHKKKVEQAGFMVLKSPDIPSILVETGFISNPKEAKRLSSRHYQQKMAKAIYQGISRYFSNNLPVGTLLAARKYGHDKKSTASKKVAANKKSTASKKVAANKKSTASKKVVANKKSTASKKVVANKKSTASKKAVANKKSTASKKVVANKKSTASKKVVANKKSSASKKIAGNKKPATYVIVDGDTLYSISVRHNVSVKSLLRHNGLKNNRIFVGQRLKIPPS